MEPAGLHRIPQHHAELWAGFLGRAVHLVRPGCASERHGPALWATAGPSLFECRATYPAKSSGCAVGFAGVAVVFSGELGTGGPRAFAASVGIIAAALATAHASVLVKARGTHIEPAVLAGTQMFGGCVPLLIGGMLLEGSPLGFRWTPMAFGALA